MIKGPIERERPKRDLMFSNQLKSNKIYYFHCIQIN